MKQADLKALPPPIHLKKYLAEQIIGKQWDGLLLNEPTSTCQDGE